MKKMKKMKNMKNRKGLSHIFSIWLGRGSHLLNKIINFLTVASGRPWSALAGPALRQPEQGFLNKIINFLTVASGWPWLPWLASLQPARPWIPY